MISNDEQQSENGMLGIPDRAFDELQEKQGNLEIFYNWNSPKLHSYKHLGFFKTILLLFLTRFFFNGVVGLEVNLEIYRNTFSELLIFLFLELLAKWYFVVLIY